MAPDLATTLAQFGLAGFIAWMWLTERRHSADRDKRLEQSHDALMAERRESDVLLRALDENTRAIVQLEATQRQMLAMIERGVGASGAAGSAAVGAGMG